MTAFFVQLQAGTKEGGVQNISYGAEMRNDVVSGHNDIPWRTLLALQGTYGILGRRLACLLLTKGRSVPSAPDCDFIGAQSFPDSKTCSVFSGRLSSQPHVSRSPMHPHGM